MGAPFLKLFLVIILLLTIATTFIDKKEPKPTTAVKFQFDFFKLALQWPPIVGLGRRYPFWPNPMKFTIHGLWHENYTTSFTACPIPTNPFNFNLFSNPLLQRLRSCWPNIERSGKDREFWKHEWEKHGGCSESLYDQVRYFELAVDLYNQFNILAALTQASVTRSTLIPVPLSKINSSIVSATTKVPILTCCPYNGGEALQEVRLCFSKQSLVIDCPSRNSQNNCRGPDIFLI